MFSEVAQEWLDYKKPNLRIRSWQVCRGHVNNHFGDLDNLRISRISVASIEKYIRKRQDEGRNINTLRKVLVTLGQILGYAARHRYIDHNPLRDAERQKNRAGRGIRSKRKSTY